MMQNRLYSVSS